MKIPNKKTFRFKATDTNPTGFTLIEVMIVIMVIGVLAAMTYSIIVPNWRERTYYSSALNQLNTMDNALNLYVAKYNDYPADVNRGIPPGIQEFIQTQQGNGNWPYAPWPGSVYDWDNWPPDPTNGPQQTYQISIRFCNAGDDATCKNNFPKESWVTSSWDSYSSVYYCIKGSCRAHQNFPQDHPGYCINCGTEKRQIY